MRNEPPSPNGNRRRFDGTGSIRRPPLSQLTDVPPRAERTGGSSTRDETRVGGWGSEIAPGTGRSAAGDRVALERRTDARLGRQFRSPHQPVAGYRRGPSRLETAPPSPDRSFGSPARILISVGEQYCSDERPGTIRRRFLLG
ncbi:hypothetical protein EA472_09380 [Natrarchaeobius oligotrophus]|uniref:Uncharacterized protein n=1 Tax=Natrarchaeobius chitinivorans TaxID=1679083 RepID=A0A3N6MI65_NATCH|nr:hypothetical protein EA472_09380 [Natrarchaeobius chitinivorans]